MFPFPLTFTNSLNIYVQIMASLRILGLQYEIIVVLFFGIG